MSLELFDLHDLDVSDISSVVVPPARGNRRIPLEVTVLGNITPEDVGVLLDNPIRGSFTPSIQKLKASHHRLARLLSEGLSQADCHLITGYSISRISLLTRDPAFMELIDHYRRQVEGQFVNFHDRLADLSMDALDELHERLTDKPETFSHRELMDLVKDTADRTGFGPKSTHVHELGGSVATLLDEVKREVAARRNGSIRALDAGTQASHYPVIEQSDYSEFEADLHPEGAAVGLESKGEDL